MTTIDGKFYHTGYDFNLTLPEIDFSKSAGLIYPRGLAVTQEEFFDGREWESRPYHFELSVSGKSLDLRIYSEILRLYNRPGYEHINKGLEINKLVEEQQIDIVIMNSIVQILTNPSAINSFKRIR